MVFFGAFFFWPLLAPVGENVRVFNMHCHARSIITALWGTHTRTLYWFVVRDRCYVYTKMHLTVHEWHDRCMLFWKYREHYSWINGLHCYCSVSYVDTLQNGCLA